MSGGSYKHKDISKVQVAKTICEVLEKDGFIGNIKVILPVAEGAFKLARPSEEDIQNR